MTNSSVSRRTFNWFLEELNKNSYGVVFSGNFRFRFWPQNDSIQQFEIIKKTEGKLEYSVEEVVPVVNIQDIEIVFNEKNKRVDLEKELYVAIKIENVRDEETQQLIIEHNENEVRYQALLETVENIRQQLVFEYEDEKYSVRIKEPQVTQTFKHEGNYYNIFAISLNLTKAVDVLYGNEIELKINGQVMDLYEMTESVGADVRRVSPLTSEKRQIAKTNSFLWNADITVNYRPNESVDRLIFNHLSRVNVQESYEIQITDDAGTVTKTIGITSGAKLYKLNKAIQMNFIVEEV